MASYSCGVTPGELAGVDRNHAAWQTCLDELIFLTYDGLVDEGNDWPDSLVVNQMAVRLERYIDHRRVAAILATAVVRLARMSETSERVGSPGTPSREAAVPPPSARSTTPTTM